MVRFSHCFTLLISLCALSPSLVCALTAPVIPANEAAAHINEWGNRGRYSRKSVHQQKWQHVSEYRGQLPKPDLHRLDTACIAGKQITVLSGIEGKRVKITGRIEMYKGKPEIRINAASQLEID